MISNQVSYFKQEIHLIFLRKIGLDLKEFEKRIKPNKIPKIVNDYIENDSNSSNEESKKPFIVEKPKKIVNNSQENESKIDQIQKEIISKTSFNKLKNEEIEIENVLNSKNEGFKDKKIKELVSKNKALTVAFEKEKSLYFDSFIKRILLFIFF